MTVYATRLVNGTDSMERMRRTDAFGLFASGEGAARGGFRNDGGAEVTVNAGTMTVDVAPFMAYVDGGVSDTQGGYTFVSDGTETLTVSPGHASLTRTDVVIAEVRDTVHDGSGSTDARVRILEGTPGAGVPALPTNALALRELNIPAGLSAGTGGLASGNLGTDRRTYTTGLGGVLTVASQAERDALPQVNGTEVYRTDTDTLEVRTASGWRTVYAPDETTVVPVATAGFSGSFTVTKRNGYADLQLGVNTSSGWPGGVILGVVPANCVPVHDGGHYQFMAGLNTAQPILVHIQADGGIILTLSGTAGIGGVTGNAVWLTETP